MPTTLHMCLLGSVLLLVWSITTSVYNLYFHPLSKYPGPLLARLTGWCEFVQVNRGYHHQWLYQMHQKYGPVVRIAPQRLSYNTTEALKTIYSDRKGNVRKAGFTEVLAALKGGARNLQTINDRHTYGPRRRLIAYAFSEEALQSSEKYILEHVRGWCSIIASKAEKPSAWTEDVDMTLWSTLLTEDVIADLCFGESFGACKKGASEFGTLIEDGCAQVQRICWMPIATALCRVLKPLIAHARKNEWIAMKPQLDYDNHIDDMIARRMKTTDPTRKDIFHYVLQAKDAETGATISPAEITMDAGVLFGAGVDTSAVCISACIFYLTRYPEMLGKVISEIRGTYSDVEEIKYDANLKSLHYLRACIDETLRISPPVPGGLLREVTNDGITINGDFIAPGTEVIVPIYAIHHNETYFPESWTFTPERWLGDMSAASKEAFCPFSSGPRMCVGYRLAYLDMALALARLLFLFDVRSTPDNDVGQVYDTEFVKFPSVREGKVEYALEDMFVTRRKGPIVQFKARA